MFVLYGAQSPGNSFLHPRDMDPAGKYQGLRLVVADGAVADGKAVADVHRRRQLFLSTTRRQQQRASQGGQAEVTAKALNQNRGLSMYGRVNSPYPLWDGTRPRAAGLSPCEVTRDGVLVSCATLTEEEIARLSGRRAHSGTDRCRHGGQRPRLLRDLHVRPGAADLAHRRPRRRRASCTPTRCRSIRAEPNATDRPPSTRTLAAQGLALIEVRSVYDTDGLEADGRRHGVRSPCRRVKSVGIAKTRPADAQDRGPGRRPGAHHDLADAAYGRAPALLRGATRGRAAIEHDDGLRRRSARPTSSSSRSPVTR